MGRTWS